MTSFTSLLSSIGGGASVPQPKPSNSSKPTAGTPGSAPPPTAARPISSNMAAGVKRKPDDYTSTPHKVVRTEVKVPVRPSMQNTNSTAKTAPAATGPPTAYKGTARPSGSVAPVRAVSKPLSRPVSGANTPIATSAASADAAPKPKRGFASIMEKAKAAQEAAKAAGNSTIKHKPVEKLSRRERQKAQEAAAGNQRAGGGMKGSRVGALADRSRSNTPGDGKGSTSQKKAPSVGYQGTMKKAVPEVAYKGTMRSSGSGVPAGKAVAKKGMPQDRYGGYASWSDLDEAEDEEDDYDSDGSSAMEAGIDDVELEEARALRIGKKEDQAAFEEEERLKREKLERKKKLLALSKDAASKRKF